MMKAQLHAEAETEMIAAAAYYESQQTDLGKRFLASVQDSDCCRHASGSPSRLLEGSVGGRGQALDSDVLRSGQCFGENSGPSLGA